MREADDPTRKSSKVHATGMRQADVLSLERWSSNKQTVSSTSQSLDNYRLLVSRAVDVFGDDTRASLWLSTPSVDLGGQVPLKIAQEDNYSLERLEPIFTRIEHGIDF